MATALQGTESAAKAIARVKYSHDAMIDMIVANPAIEQNALAAAFGYTVPWVSRVMNSDAFQARLAERKTEIVDPALIASVDEKLRTLASKSLDILIDKLSLAPNLDTALKAVEVSTRALGYGARQQNVAVQQNFVVALPGKAVTAEAWSQAHTPGGGQVVEGELIPVPSPSEKIQAMAQAGAELR